MPDLDKPALLAAWMEGTLTPEQRAAFEKACSEDEAFSLQVETANMALMEADQYQSQPVPEWERESTFIAEEKPAWWQWQWLPATSFCTSLIAIVMVVSGFQVKVENGAMTMSFADSVDQTALQAMVDERIQSFRQDQQMLLTEYTQAMQKQQLEANTELTKYLLTSSRQERREDFAELIKFINEQRSDDQLFYARQLNKLQDEIYSLPDRPVMTSVPVVGSVEN